MRDAQEQRLREFTARQHQRTRRPVRRGAIDPSVMLPPLDKLLAIDAAAELAVSATRIDGDARTAAGTTVDTCSGCGAQEAMVTG